jgi:hypothetical protein
MGKGPGLAARASASVSTYSRMFVNLPSRTVMAKTKWSSNVLFVALTLPLLTPTTRTRSKSGPKAQRSRCKTISSNVSKRQVEFTFGIKDANNDGVPELLIAADRGDAVVMIGIYGMSEGRFSEIAVLSGQHRIYIFERGHIAMPYGSVGLSWHHTWKDGAFHAEELHDPLRRLPPPKNA